jgi:hypothetical protein
VKGGKRKREGGGNCEKQSDENKVSGVEREGDEQVVRGKAMIGHVARLSTTTQTLRHSEGTKTVVVRKGIFNRGKLYIRSGL